MPSGSTTGGPETRSAPYSPCHLRPALQSESSRILPPGLQRLSLTRSVVLSRRMTALKDVTAGGKPTLTRIRRGNEELTSVKAHPHPEMRPAASKIMVQAGHRSANSPGQG